MQGMLVEEVLGLPAAVDVVTAGRALGVGRDRSYRLAKRGEFPVRVVRIGHRMLVTRADLLSALGLADARTMTRGTLTGGAALADDWG